ncbi:hypothetical protein JQN58_11560 [Aneurinibacillus sp. BA2021]|nr:hypothetical protein [Aneurinibacillus sp. BA2021]
MANREKIFPGVVGIAILKAFDLECARTGLHEEEARKAGISFACITQRTKDHAGYYPDARTLYVKLLYEADAHTVIGGQIAGYAPPLSGVWDPIQQAVREALKGMIKEKGI